MSFFKTSFPSKAGLGAAEEVESVFELSVAAAGLAGALELEL